MSWTLLHPEALAFLLLAPAILVLHLVRKRPRPHAVPFLKIWDRAEPRRGGGFKRLRDRLALLFALLLVGLLTAALARPVRPEPDPEYVLLLVDNSASMDARDSDGLTRLEKALRKLREAVSRAPEHVLFALAVTAPAPALLLSFETPRPDLSSSLASMKSRPMPGDTAGALADVAPILRGLPGSQVWLVSDRPADEIPDRIGGDVPVRRLLVGDRTENVRIAAFNGAWGGWWDANASFYIRAENMADSPASCTLVVRAAEEILLDEPIELPARGSFEKTFQFERKDHEVIFFAEISPGGALGTDDRAWCRVPGCPRKRVLLVSKSPGAFVQSAVQGLGDWVDRGQSGVVNPDSWKKVAGIHDIVVFEGTGPGAVFPAGGCFVIGAPPGSLPTPNPGEEVEDAAVLDWDLQHPATTGLSFDGVFFRAFRPLPGEYSPLVSTDRGAAAGARQGPGGRAVVLSSSLGATNLGLLSSFPLFLRNALRWVGGDDVPGGCPDLSPGCTRAPEGYSILWEEGPKGGPGVAVLYRKGERNRLAVNFFCPLESELSAPGETGDPVLPVLPARPPGADPWKALLWAGIVVLALDWILLFWRRGWD